jgi:small subunit ribosomal protein S19
MTRSLKKGPYIDEGLMKKVKLMKAAGGPRRPIKTWARRCTVVPEMVGQSFAVHNGNKFINVYVTENMVGHRLGEFSPTRTFRGHREPRGEAETKAAAAS